MRKDLRVGLGIGGVLLAVLIVALVVRTHNNPIQQAHSGQAAPPEPTAAADDTPPANPSVEAGPQAPFQNEVPPAPPQPPEAAKVVVDSVFGDPVDVAPPPQPARPQTPPVAATGGTNWELMLATGEMAGTRSAPVSPKPTPPANFRPAAGGRAAGGSAAGGSAAGGSAADQIIERNPTPPTADRVATASGGGGGAASPRTAAGGNIKTRVVRDGDSLSTIARDVYGSKKYHVQLQAANPGIDPKRMRVGTKLVIPDLTDEIRADASAPAAASGATAMGSASIGARSTIATMSPLDARRNYRVQAGDNLNRISERLYGTPGKVDALYDLNRVAIGPDRDRLKLHMLLKLPEPPTIASLR